MARGRKKQREAQLTGHTSFRVRFSEVDSMKIVWHGEYVRYFEDGREAFGKEYAGLSYMDIYESGFTAPMVELNLEYRHPLTIGDVATVETRYIHSPAAKICFDYIIRRESDGVIVATGSSMQVFLNGANELELLTPEFYQNWKKRWGIEK